MSDLIKSNSGLQEYQNVELLQQLIDSKKLPAHIKDVNDAVVVRQMGAELGMPFMQAAHHLYPVNGRLTLSAQGMQALLKRAGIKWKTILDAQEEYLTGADGKLIPDANGRKQLVNVVTIIRFYRDGMEEDVKFTLKDAKAAGLLTKQPWQQYRDQMLWNRAFTMGARRVGADCLLGICYTAEELGSNFVAPIVDLTEDGQQIVDIPSEDVTQEQSI